MLKKTLNWLSQSNRYKHLLGGFVLGSLCSSPYCALLCGFSVAGALEFKDIQWGGKWDWIDWLLTIGGVSIGYTIKALII